MILIIPVCLSDRQCSHVSKTLSQQNVYLAKPQQFISQTLSVMADPSDIRLYGGVSALEKFSVAVNEPKMAYAKD